MNRTYKINRVEHRVEVLDLPAALEGLRIVHFGDLHLPKPPEFVRQLNALLRQADGHLLVTTGDILDHAHWLSVARRQLPVLLEGLRPALGFHGSLGNHDRPRTAQVLAAVGATVLVNRWTTIPVGPAALNLGGVYSYRTHRWPEVCRRLAAHAPPQGPAIVLSHLPSAIWTLSGPRVDLVLSGHTHGGQWRFPGLGCVWAHDAIPLRMAYGLHKVGPTQLYVTAGVGESGPIPVRWRCPPEIAVLTLHRACKGGC